MCAISYEPQSRSLTINFSQAKLDIGFEITRHGVFFIERDGRGISNIQLPDDCLLQVNSREAKRLRRFGSAGIEVYAVYMERGNWKVALASNRMIKKLAHGRTALFFVAPSGTVQINEIGPVTVNFPAP